MHFNAAARAMMPELKPGQIMSLYYDEEKRSISFKTELRESMGTAILRGSSQGLSMSLVGLLNTNRIAHFSATFFEIKREEEKGEKFLAVYLDKDLRNREYMWNLI
jgi:hypothetical protein